MQTTTVVVLNEGIPLDLLLELPREPRIEVNGAELTEEQAQTIHRAVVALIVQIADNRKHGHGDAHDRMLDKRDLRCLREIAPFFKPRGA